MGMDERERQIALLRLARRVLEGEDPDSAAEVLWGIDDEERARAIAARLSHAGSGAPSVDTAPGDAFVAELIALLSAACEAGVEARLRYREMLERASDGIYVVDANGRYIDVNESGASMLGFTKDELCQLHIFELVDPNDPPIDVASVRAGRSITRIRNVRRKDGSFMLSELSSHMLPDGTLFGIARDVTERERVQRELRETTRRFQQALRAARAGTWEWIVGTNQVHWSEETYLLMGFEPGDGRTTYELWLDCVHEDDRELASELVVRAVSERDDLDLEYRVVRPDGSLRWMRAVGQTVVGDDGTPVAMYGIQLDVTESKEAELARAAAEVRLNQAHRMEAIGRLAGGIAHDFNNLLTVILAATEVVTQEIPTHGLVGEHFDAVRQAASRGAALTRQLLTLSRHNPPETRQLNVSVEVRRMVPILRRLLGEDIEIRTELADGLRPVRMDASQLDQVVLNLAINARDAMPSGGRVSFTTSAAGDGSVVLTVSDTGVGMSADTRARAFEPFFTTKPEGTGTGLGLATVYGIVTQRGGDIVIDSEPDRGTVVRIHLPSVDPAAPEDAPELSSKSTAPEGALVLVVEDEPAVRRIVRRILESVGHRVIEAATGAEALEVARDAGAQLDAVVSDVVMPGMSGPELTKRLREVQPGVAVLLMSGYLGDVLARHGVATDVELLEKPFAPDGLLEALGRALAQSPRSERLSTS